jgi:alanine-glyoxylate transaminase/serine-glyoxylate transaminase/serine-pyruvate transaminase
MKLNTNHFAKLLEEISHGLRYAFQTNNTFTLAVVGTGTMGMETTLDNLVEIGDTVLIPVIGGWGTQVKGIVARLGRLY